MAKPNDGLIKETNLQYQSGVQIFKPEDYSSTGDLTTTFNTDLVLGSGRKNNPDYALNNFRLYYSISGAPGTFVEMDDDIMIVNEAGFYGNLPNAGNVGKVIRLPNEQDYFNNATFAVQLLNAQGGSFADEEAFGDTTEKNYGGYAYTSLEDVISNFMVGYVGSGKLIPSVKATDVVFFAKRGLQEFSYDTLKSVKSKEFNIPANLSIPLPQDYVNYVKVSWVDSMGVKHIIYPTTLTSNPYETPSQDNVGVGIQDNFAETIDLTSQTEERWKSNNLDELNEAQSNLTGLLQSDGLGYGSSTGNNYTGQRFGLQPETSQVNGWFTINDRTGSMSFSSDLAERLIIFEYISDGVAYESDMRIPKLAEEALYAHISHGIIASRINQPEYLVQRLKREKSAKLRNAKLRLSNIKLSEFVQIARGKSKQIKY